MKIYLTILLTLSLLYTTAQQSSNHSVQNKPKEMTPLTSADAILFQSIEDVSVPEGYRSFKLPDSVDNSKYEWFRPIFNQDGMSCMQASSIGYNFTYEINRLRNLSADTSDNQYTSHFAWNFFNGGNGWFGVNYLFTADVLKHHGTPNATDYGGMFLGSGFRWMSGYDEWYNAMNNRIHNIWKIRVDNEDGLEILKHWLYSHLDSSETGGLANFIACSPWGIDELPEGTPNAGKKVMTHFCPDASHGMTIVGYNDSIRFDYNDDGLYTNHIDINEDGVVDMKDWEIGGLKFANSHGDNWADEGFCYMMYKTLADPISIGGIWMNTVHVFEAKESHSTPLTFKVSLEHSYRERVRVRTGISTNMESSKPDYVLDYTILNYQGAWHYMQGIDSLPEYKTIEFGLDLSPLLQYVEPGQACKFFLIVDERDPQNFNYGQVNSLSLMDYSGSTVIETPCNQQNVPLVENGRTLLAIEYHPNFDDVEITNTELPVYEPGQPMEIQMNASGGEQPYTWHLDKNYEMNTSSEDFPVVDEHLLIASSFDDSTAIQALEFEFPFYGNRYDTVLVSFSGYIAFDENMYFWPYLVDMAYFLKNSRVIAPFLCSDLMIYNEFDHGLWYEGDENSATFRWKTGYKTYLNNSDMNFAVTLYADGNIEFYYGDFLLNDQVNWISGIADGDFYNYSLPDLPPAANLIPDTKIQFLPSPQPDSVNISRDGVLHILENETNMNKDIRIGVTDKNLLQSEKTFQLTDGLEFSIETNGSNSNILTNGTTSNIDLYVKNKGPAAIQNIEFALDSDEDLLSIADGSESLSSLQSGESIFIESAFAISTSEYVSDLRKVILNLQAQSASKLYNRDYIFSVSSANMEYFDIEVMNENGILAPGETADLKVSIINNGSANSSNTKAVLIADAEGIQVNSAQPISLGTIQPGEMAVGSFNITADHTFKFGAEVGYTVQITDDIGLLQEIHFRNRIGKVPVCVIDMDPGTNSGPQIYELLQQMDVESKYTISFPATFEPYQSVILCLGTIFSNHELNHQQSYQLKQFLDNGGRLYMEGRQVWMQDPLPTVVDKFNVELIVTPGLYEVLDGVDGTFTEGLAYENSVTQPYSYCYFEPVEPAFSILTGREYPNCAAVAYEAGDYKTICTIFEMGALMSSDTCLLQTYLRDVLDFFEIVETSYGIEEVISGQLASTIQNYPNPFSQETRVPLKLAEKSFVDAAVYDLQGRRIYDLIQASQHQKGKYNLVWDGRNNAGQDMPGGIYIFRVLINDKSHTGKMILIR